VDDRLDDRRHRCLAGRPLTKLRSILSRPIGKRFRYARLDSGAEVVDRQLDPSWPAPSAVSIASGASWIRIDSGQLELEPLRAAAPAPQHRGDAVDELGC